MQLKPLHKHAIALTTAAAVATAALVLAPQHCHSVNGLPDPACTPGVVNPNITQDNLAETLCNPNWSTKSIRPPVSYTNPLKLKQLQQYDYQDKTPQDFEEDHLISLELGGSPTDPHNLWPEEHTGPNNSYQKDKIENALHRWVCEGRLTLSQAQQLIATDWTQVQSPLYGSVGADQGDE